MRKDQLKRLEELSERICEVFISEADPESWNGAGFLLADMDEKTRGNRLWDKKNAVQTGALLARALDIRERAAGARNPMDEVESEGEIKRFEKKAKALIDGIQHRASAKPA